MKKILITGKNSYIGSSFEKWLEGREGEYQISTVDTLNNAWQDISFKGFDAVFHVAGIAHVSTDPKLEKLYYSVNRDLAIAVAKKAKAEGVGQFVFMSSIIVYGDSAGIGKRKLITRDTAPAPANFYGNSKLQAEQGLQAMEGQDFKVAVIRPPMIYGKDSKGNYQKLSKLARVLPLFPDIDNERSMLYIDNLCEFLRLVIDNGERGIFFPQNEDYTSTKEMVKQIAGLHGKSIKTTKLFNPLIRLMSRRSSMVNKAFGSLAYDKSMSEYKVNYRVKGLKESLEATEGV